MDTVGTLLYTLALLWFFISISNQDETEVVDVYYRITQIAIGLSLVGVLVLSGYRARIATHFSQIIIIAILAAIVIYALRDLGIFKNSIVFWVFLVPIIFPNRDQSRRVNIACDVLWIVVFGVVLIQIFLVAASGSITSALFGDSLQGVFTERTWTGVFFGMYGLIYHDRWSQRRSRVDLFRSVSSILISILTVSFAVIIALTVIAAIRIYKKRPLLSASMGLVAFCTLLFIPLGRFSTLDAKMGNRNIAFEDEFYLYRSIGDVLGGFYTPPIFGLDYAQLPGVPTIGIDSFSLPAFIINNFGIVGVFLIFMIAKTALRVGNMGWAVVFAFIVALIHPVHLQPGFVLLVALLGVSGSQSFTRLPETRGRYGFA